MVYTLYHVQQVIYRFFRSFKSVGLIVKIFKDHMHKIEKSVKAKFEFDQIQIFNNQDVFIASTVITYL